MRVWFVCKLPSRSFERTLKTLFLFFLSFDLISVSCEQNPFGAVFLKRFFWGISFSHPLPVSQVEHISVSKGKTKAEYFVHVDRILHPWNQFCLFSFKLCAQKRHCNGLKLTGNALKKGFSVLPFQWSFLFKMEWGQTGKKLLAIALRAHCWEDKNSWCFFSSCCLNNRIDFLHKKQKKISFLARVFQCGVRQPANLHI